MAEIMVVVAVDAIHQVREFMRQALAVALQDELLQVYQANCNDEYLLTAEAMGQRSLKKICLSYMMLVPRHQHIVVEQFNNAGNMTDQMAAFRAICHQESEYRQQTIEKFYQQ